MSSGNPKVFARRRAIGLLVLGFVCLIGVAAAEEPIQDRVLRDVLGNEHRLQPGPNERATIVLFVTTDCPIANSYQPELRRMQSEFEKIGFRFLLIHEGIELSAERLQEHAKEYDIGATLIADHEHQIAKWLGASVTPEVIVIGPEGQRLYQGRIDDRHPKYGKKRPVASNQDLRSALTAIADGKPILQPRTEAVGCLIRFAREE